MSRGASAGVGRAEIAEALSAIGLQSSVNGLPQRDFGGVVRATPSAIVDAHTADEVKRVFAVAGELDLPVVTQGTAHSVGGQSLVSDGIILRNRVREEPDWVSEDEIDVPTGLHWRGIESVVRERGRAIPVVTSVLDISAGGTLAVGGYGTATPRRGAQIDHVRGLELVTPNGETHWCSEAENEELFRFSLAGAGQLGVITRVRLRTEPSRPSAELHGYSVPSLSAMAEALEWMGDPDVSLPPYMRAFSYKPDRPGIVLFGRLGKRPSEGDGLSFVEGDAELERVRERLGPAETVMPADDVRLLEDQFDSDWVDRYPDHFRLWVDAGFSYDGFRTYCRELERLARLGTFGKAIRAVYVSVVPNPRGGSGYFPFDIRAPERTARTFTCGVYCMVPAGDAQALSQARRGLDAAAQLVAGVGGRPYIYGFNEMGPASWRRAFGSEAVEQLQDLKAKVDRGRLIPPPWDRIGTESPPPDRWRRTRRFRPTDA